MEIMIAISLDSIVPSVGKSKSLSCSQIFAGIRRLEEGADCTLMRDLRGPSSSSFLPLHEVNDI